MIPKKTNRQLTLREFYDELNATEKTTFRKRFAKKVASIRSLTNWLNDRKPSNISTIGRIQALVKLYKPDVTIIYPPTTPSNNNTPLQ